MFKNKNQFFQTEDASKKLKYKVKPNVNTPLPRSSNLTNHCKMSSNIKKCAAALFQNDKELKAARQEAGAVFGVVKKCFGFKSFVVMPCSGEPVTSLKSAASVKEITGIPRGLFTRRTMRISVGSVVLLEGTFRSEGDQRPSLPWEIKALVDSKAQLDTMVQRGQITAALRTTLVETSASASSLDSSSHANDDLFEPAEDSPEAVETFDCRGGKRAEKKAEEARLSIASRLGCLKSGKKGLDGSTTLGDALVLTVVTEKTQEQEDAEAFAAFMRSSQKPKAVVGDAAEVSTPDELEAFIQAQKKSMWLAEAAEASAALVAEAAGLAKAEAAAKFFSAQKVKDAWDEEEIDAETL